MIVDAQTRIETAGPADADAVLRLLAQNHLPLDGPEDTTTLVARRDAERYFPKFGFERIQRLDVPPTVQTSIEFTSACPSSATVMRKSL